MADALLGKNDFEGAARHFRSLPRAREAPAAVGRRVALRFAAALLNHPKEAHAEEAVHLARRVLWESTGGPGRRRPRRISRSRRWTRCRPSGARRSSTSPREEQLAKARGLAASGQPREAVLVTDRLVKLPKAKKPGEFSCDVWLVRGEALVKMRTKKPEAADAYKGAIEHCAGPAARARTRSSRAAGRRPRRGGRSRRSSAFALLEKDHPSPPPRRRRAAARGARRARRRATRRASMRMLETIADAYPEGDVSNDGLFELALFHVGKRDWAGAVPPLEKALARAPRERAYWAAGRLPYFLARAHLETGAVAQGRAELAGVIRDYPLSYYMALAHARLADRDRGAADRALAEAAAREPAGRRSPCRAGPGSTIPAFARALELLRQGDVKLARGELDRLGFTCAHGAARGAVDGGVPPRAAGGVRPVAPDPAHAGEHAAARGTTSSPTGSSTTPPAAGARRGSSPIRGPSRPSSPPRRGAGPARGVGLRHHARGVGVRRARGVAGQGLRADAAHRPDGEEDGRELGLSPDEESLKQPAVNIPVGCHYLTCCAASSPTTRCWPSPGTTPARARRRSGSASGRGTTSICGWSASPTRRRATTPSACIATMAAYEFLYAREQPSEALRAPLAASPAAAAAAP